VSRRPHLDWLRGVAVLIMIEGHTLDSWTRVADRQLPAYQWAIVLAGFGAPLFLFLAGITLILAAGGRLRKGTARSEVARAAFRRGAWILVLAFVFRLQALLISRGEFPKSLLKVDILNIMGVSMLIGAVGWAAAKTPTRRATLFIALTGAAAMLTPIIRHIEWLNGLPDPLEAYVRPLRGLTNFALFPWAGFLMAGCAVGVWLDARAATGKDGRTAVWIPVVGLAMTAGGYAASVLPPLYADSEFWTSSPTFFFIRLGLLLLGLSAADVLSQSWRAPALQQFGRASLFVYWVHVEMVYGVLSAPFHRRLPFPLAVIAFAVFALAMFGLVKLKDRLKSSRFGQFDINRFRLAR
jgi:uncharacterized membrane protein